MPSDDSALVIKPSNIRIWIHQKDLGKLQRVLWEGHGNKLKVETSNNPRVKRFLEAVPRLMGLIKEIHLSVVNDNIEELIEKTEDPVPPAILTSKDNNGLTVLHKAAGLGRHEIAKYIIEKCPSTVTITDNEGRTPLHYAATLKDNGAIFDMLLDAGADESQLDHRHKSAGYYRNRPSDIDPKMLVSVPEAPRTPNSSFPASWDWSLLTSEMVQSQSEYSGFVTSHPSISNLSKSLENVKPKRKKLEKAGSIEKKARKRKEDARVKEEDEDDDDNDQDEDGGEKNGDEEEKNDDDEEEKKHDDDEEQEKNDVDEEEEKNDDEDGEIKNIDEPDDGNDAEKDDVNESDDEMDVDENEDVESGVLMQVDGDENKEDDVLNDEDDFKIMEDDHEINEKDEDEDEDDGNADKNNDENNEEMADDEVSLKDDGIGEEELLLEKEEDGDGDVHHNSDEMNNIDPTIEETNGEQNDRISVEGEEIGENEQETLNEDRQKHEDSDELDDKDQELVTKSELKDDEMKGDLLNDSIPTIRINSGTEFDADSLENPAVTDDGLVQESLELIATDDNMIETNEVPDNPENFDDNVENNDVINENRTNSDENIDGDLGEGKADVPGAVDPAQDTSKRGPSAAKDSSRPISTDDGLTPTAVQGNVEPKELAKDQLNVLNQDTIVTVHELVRLGKLDDLTEILREKLNDPGYLISHTKSTPNGGTPLHVATVFGYKDIVQYLGENFPETILAEDDNGRTALHYAATLPDDGEIFDLLLALGADRDKKDNVGNIPEVYKKYNKTFSYQSLLKDFGEHEQNNPDSTDNENEVTESNVTETNPAISERKKRSVKKLMKKESLNDPDEDSNSKHSERVIEGLVNEDDEALNNDGQKLTYSEEDDNISETEIRRMIEMVNMEQLAALVLNGNGGRLIGRKSTNVELQAFLDNIPSYMGKIRRVHQASREGNLRELQAALDRRKFAIARDKISPNGATPLHVAVIFGNTNIVRYLAGRFPETVHMEDYAGRTPLHYAATIGDNGHYYNLLLHLGANAKAQDHYHHKAEYYRNNFNELSHRSLLRDFGAEEQLEVMLNDRGSIFGSDSNIPLFQSEEGRYLATSLGDPLLKGLSEVASKKPKNPIAYLATYLANAANKPGHNHDDQPLPAQERRREREMREPTAESDYDQQTTGDVRDNHYESEAIQPNIEVVALPPDRNTESPEMLQSAFSAPNRDEHGQSMIHFAAARSHAPGELFQILDESQINIGYRDELYRTARDVSIQANIAENTTEIDKWVLFVAARGDINKMIELLLEGYDHILDVTDDANNTILHVAQRENQQEMVAFLQSILTFEEKRERVHHAIRLGDTNLLTDLLADDEDSGSGRLLAIAKNTYGRCGLHIAVLCQQEEIIDYLTMNFPETLRIGDNLERTALHYAMGVDKVEVISGLLIRAGAKRVMKDLKGRQPSYYFINKADILRLQEEEETF